MGDPSSPRVALALRLFILRSFRSCSSLFIIFVSFSVPYV
ncbi:hypothetical protein Leryth_026395 [Lithospermum erythrorhizon]|nr:hypothetical protein Leryth_026395 [Lithospermum erythrorhizon]